MSSDKRLNNINATSSQTQEQLDRQLTELLKLLKQINYNLKADKSTRIKMVRLLRLFVERDVAGEELTCDDPPCFDQDGQTDEVPNASYRG